MRVHLDPVGHYSPAMVRIAGALERYAPEGIVITRNPSLADLRVVYLIGPGGPEIVSRICDFNNQRVAIVQCCVKTSGIEAIDWVKTWNKAEIVWSYYDLSYFVSPSRFYHAPLGIDDAFYRRVGAVLPTNRRGVVTTGHVHGDTAEAILEVAIAAREVGIPLIHVGPVNVVGMTWPHGGERVHATDVSDEDLAQIYSHAQFVSGLRHVEGFELPIVEGLACGAVPIAFRRPESHWFDGLAELVDESSGDSLVSALVDLFTSLKNETVSFSEQAEASNRFNWATIAGGFWKQLLKENA